MIEALTRWRPPAALLPLRDRWWWLFLCLWLPCATLALVGGGYAAVQVSASRTPPMAMIGLSMSGGPGWELGPAVGREATAAGIRKGDRLIGIDGKPASADAAGLIDQIAGPTGTGLTAAIAHPDGRVTTHRLTRSPRHFEEGLASAGLTPAIDHAVDVIGTFILGALLPIALAVLLLVQRPRDPLAPWASLMMLLLALGNGAIADWLYLSGGIGRSLTGIANEIGFDLMVLVLALAPEGRFSPRASWAVVLISPIAIHLSGMLPRPDRVAILFTCVVAAVALILVRFRAMPPGLARQQIRWTIGGFLCACAALVGLLVIQYLRPQVATFAAKEWVFVLGTLFAGLPIGLIEIGLTVALLRYRLYDADVTISRSIAYGGLTVSLIGIFAATQKLIEKLGADYVGGTLGDLAQAVAAALAAVLVVPINRRVSRWAENHFQGALVNLRHHFPRLIGDLRETVAPDRLARTALTEVRKGVRAASGAIIVHGEIIDRQEVDAARLTDWLAAWRPPVDPHGLYAHRDDPLFPMRIALSAEGAGDVGWLLLGPRPDGSFYGRDERAALADIAGPVTHALAIAITRRDREAERGQEVGSLRERIEWLQRRLDEIEGKQPQQAG